MGKAKYISSRERTCIRCRSAESLATREPLAGRPVAVQGKGQQQRSSQCGHTPHVVPFLDTACALPGELPFQLRNCGRTVAGYRSSVSVEPSIPRPLRTDPPDPSNPSGPPSPQGFGVLDV